MERRQNRVGLDSRKRSDSLDQMKLEFNKERKFLRNEHLKLSDSKNRNEEEKFEIVTMNKFLSARVCERLKKENKFVYALGKRKAH